MVEESGDEDKKWSSKLSILPSLSHSPSLTLPAHTKEASTKGAGLCAGGNGSSYS